LRVFFIIIIKKKSMKKNLFLILLIIFLVGGNILSYNLNGRMMKPMTNLLMIGMLTINIIRREK
jgi:hypothetical protein